jgi:hypothetical protein
MPTVSIFTYNSLQSLPSPGPAKVQKVIRPSPYTIRRLLITSKTYPPTPFATTVSNKPLVPSSMTAPGEPAHLASENSFWGLLSSHVAEARADEVLEGVKEFNQLCGSPWVNGRDEAPIRAIQTLLLICLTYACQYTVMGSSSPGSTRLSYIHRLIRNRLYGLTFA